MISAPNGGCYWLVLPCPLHRWLRVCLVPAELRVSVWCQLGTDARDSLYLALNGRMLRARYTSPAFRLLLPVRSHRFEIPTTSWDVAKKAKFVGYPTFCLTT